jgi:H+/gluconate symporter-like permease
MMDMAMVEVRIPESKEEIPTITTTTEREAKTNMMITMMTMVIMVIMMMKVTTKSDPMEETEEETEEVMKREEEDTEAAVAMTKISRETIEIATGIEIKTIRIISRNHLQSRLKPKKKREFFTSIT